jgi:hypothetical protein
LNVRMFCFTWNICQIIFDALGIEIWQHVPVIVVKKITNVLWTACICQLIFKNLNTYTTIIKYKSAWKMFVCMTIIQSIKFLNNFIDTYLSTTFYILYSPHFIFDLDHIILHWIEGIMSLLLRNLIDWIIVIHTNIFQALLYFIIVVYVFRFLKINWQMHAVHSTFVIFLTTMTGTCCHISIPKVSKIIWHIFHVKQNILTQGFVVSTVQKGQGGQPPPSPFGKNLQKITPWN